MRYIIPVTDRAITDIQRKTAKGYLNAADWNRIQTNLWNTNLLVQKIAGTSTPTNYTGYSAFKGITYIPLANDLGAIFLDADNCRVWSTIPVGAYPGIVVVPYLLRYRDGSTYGEWRWHPELLTYSAFNLLELLIDAVYMHVAAYRSYSTWVTPVTPTARRPRCNVAICGLGMTDQNGFADYN